MTATVMGARGTRPNWCEHVSERAGIDRRFVIGMNRIIDYQQCSRGKLGDEGSHIVVLLDYVGATTASTFRPCPSQV